jgi:O-glycosyl hydrolase
MAWDSAGNFLIASSGDVDLYGLEYFVAKYSAAGTRLWTRQQGYGAYEVATDAAGNVLIGGQTSLLGECCNSEAFAAKYSPAGQLLWTRILDGWSYFGTDDVIGNTVATDAAGNVVVAGYTFKCDDWRYFAFLAKYNADGKFLWTRKFVFGDNASGRAIATDAAGNVVIVGMARSSPDGPGDAFVAKYSPAGKRLWTRQFGTPEDDWASDVTTDAAGNVVIGGTTWGSLGGPNQGSDDAFVAKYSPAGKRLWTRQFGTPENDSASGVATDAAGNIVIDGMTWGSLGGPNRGLGDVFIVKLRP